MSPSGLALVSLALLAGLTALAVAAYAWRNRAEPGAASFAALTAGVAVWSLSYAAALTTFDPAARELFELPLEVGKALVAPAWLFFALGYTGRGERVTRRLVAAVGVVPILTLVLVATNDVHGLLWTDYRVAPTFGAATVLFEPGPWFYVHAAFGWAVIGVGMVFLLEPVVAYGTLYRDQGIALILGAGVSLVGHVKATFLLPPAPALDLTPLTLAVTGVLFGFALFRFELQGLLPATQLLGRRAAIEDVGVGLVVCTADGALVEFNAAARPVLGIDADVDADAVAGTPLSAYVPDVDLAGDGLADDGPRRIEQRVDGYRAYEATVSGIDDHHGRVVGHTVTFADVTERETRRQRLEVLNRVLRHNLRNDMTVVVGNADLLAERVDDDDAPLADAVARRGRALQRLGEKARDVEELLAADDRAVELDAAALCREVVGEVAAAYPDADVTVDAPDRLPIAVRESVLSVVARNLVENALEHGGDGVAVRVRLRADSAGVRLTVADDGPGVPDAELESVRAGTETPLSHGSGLGLWVVNWGARALGAELAFADRRPTGTEATVTLPPSARVDGTAVRAESETEARAESG